MIGVIPATLPRRQGRVLLMDDELSVCEVVQAILVEFGPWVVAVAAGHEAVALFDSARASGKPFTIEALAAVIAKAASLP